LLNIYFILCIDVTDSSAA
jgi:hypothetical protein